MTYTLTMRDDVEGSVCVVPTELREPAEGVLHCAPDVAVAVANGVARRGGRWTAHPTLEVSGRPVAVAGCDVTASIVAAVNAGTPVDAALATSAAATRGLAPAA